MIEICERRIKIQTGPKSQTVNICDSANINGRYDYTVRLHPPFISEEVLLRQHFNSIQDIVEYLERHYSGEVERRPRLGGATDARSMITSTEPLSRHPLVAAFQSADVNSFASLAEAASALSEDALLTRFEEQRNAAPYRGLQRCYFVGHTGRTTSGASTNRREEHLAIALWSAYRESGFTLPDETVLFPIDYQLPLKSHRDAANAGLGKVDLFCADGTAEPWIAELKIYSERNGRVDTPLKAALEALAYCATLDPDMRYLSRESDDKKRTLLHIVNPSRPNLLVLAPTEYWNCCNIIGGRHGWREPLEALRQRIELALKIRVLFVRIDNCRWEMTPQGIPQLTEIPAFDWALPA